MQIKLLKLRKGSVLIIRSSEGVLKWSEVGDCVDVSDEIGHGLIAKYPDVLGIAKSASKKKAAAKKDDATDDNIDAEAEKMASEYANKKL